MAVRIRRPLGACLAMLASCSCRIDAADNSVPRLRHVNYIALDAKPDTDLKCVLVCVQHGFREYQDKLRVRLLEPGGETVARLSLSPGATGELSARVAWEGMTALEVNSGWNLASVNMEPPMPYAFRCGVEKPLKTVGAWGPLHFFVPQGTSYFNIWIHASVRGEGLRFELFGPDGASVRTEEGDFDMRTKVQCKVPRGADGASWSMSIAKPETEGLVLDDVYVELGRHLPPFLAPMADWAARFATGWSYDPEAVKRASRLAPRAPEIPAFRGLAGQDMDAAYVRHGQADWRTSLPVTYVLDYGSKHLGHDEYIQAVSTAPPALLHLGKDVPLNHGWGPVRALGGENQAYGSGDCIELISPSELRQRITDLRGMVDQLHASGVRYVTPYICAMTVNGDDSKRSGFWSFYDRWNEYLALGLADRPASDPREWLQRTPDGAVLRYYRYKDGYYPPFKTNHRYAACWRAEGWRTWLGEVVRFAARCGYDGVFVDNGTSQRCQCPRCLSAFRAYLRQHVTPAQLRTILGNAAPESVAFPTSSGTPLHAEMLRFWCASLREQMAVLKAIGTKELGRDFVIFPNGGRPGYIQRALRDTDFVMFEKSTGDYGTHPGMVRSPVFDTVRVKAFNDNVFELKFVQCLRRRVRPIILTRAGYPKRRPWLMLNPDAARLGMAECAAFSGGGGFLLRPYFDIYHDPLNEYRRFFEQNPHLFVGLQSCAETAVIVFPEQGWHGNPAHVASAKAMTRLLTEHHTLFDHVSEERFEPVTLEAYRTVVAPEVQVLSTAQIATLRMFVRGGGRLAVIGEFASRDQAGGERPAPAEGWAAWLQDDAAAGRASARGTVTCFADSETAAAVLGETSSVLHCADAALGTHAKVNAFRTPAGESTPRLLYHVVNYNVPLGVEPEAPIAVHGLSLRIAEPEGSNVRHARGYAPGEEPQILRVRREAGRVEVMLPALRIYRVVEIVYGGTP